MKRYFTFATAPDPATYRPQGRYHYMSLPGSGFICVVEEEGTAVPSTWSELPHLLDSAAANFNGVDTTSGAYVAPSGASGPAPTPIGGVALTDSMFQIATKLSKINRHFRP